MSDQEEQQIALAEVLARCERPGCIWTGRADELVRTRLREIEIGGDERKAEVVRQEDRIIISCPICSSSKIKLLLPPDLPAGRYKVDLSEGLDPGGATS